MFTVTYSLRLLYHIIWKGSLGFRVQGYHEFFFMIGPIFLIGAMVTFLGGVFSWLIFPHPIFFHLLMEVKFINLCLIICGRGLILIYLNKVWKIEELKFIFFFGSIWFLPRVTRGRLVIFINKFIFYFLKIDQGWFEECGSRGAIKFNYNFSYNIGLVRYIRINIVYLFIVGIFFFVSFLFL